MAMTNPTGAVPLELLGSVSPYFVLELEDQSDDSLIPASSFANRSQSEELAAAIDRVQRGIGAGERWIAASILYRRIAYRLTSIYAGSIALGGAPPDLGAEVLRLSVRERGPLRLVARQVVPLNRDAAWERLTRDHLDPLAEAIRGQVRIARRLLEGNLASSLMSSLRTLARAGRVDLDVVISEGWANPDRCRSFGSWVERRGELCYARSTCCGYERLSTSHRCQDCSLDFRPIRQRANELDGRAVR